MVLAIVVYIDRISPSCFDCKLTALLLNFR